MRLLLDTNAFLWLTAQPTRLSQAARGLLADPGNDVLLSIVSPWEIAIKARLGKLDVPLPVAEYARARVARHSLQWLPITLDHVSRVAELPLHHRDPFDRLLIAQAQIERLPILTSDPRIALYAVEVIPAV